MWDDAARSLLYLIGTALLAGGGLGLYRLLRFQRRDAAEAIDTAARLNDSFGALLDRYEERDRRLTAALEECEDDRSKLMRRRHDDAP